MTCSALGSLVTTASRLVPALEGKFVGHPPCSDDAMRCDASPAPEMVQQMAHQMAHHCAQEYPEAGRQYCARRCWGLLIWQPIYLSVIAVYHSDVLPLLGHVCLTLRQGLICGYTMYNHVPLSGTREQRMQWACTQLRIMCDRFYASATEVIRINPRASACMQADCLLEALLIARADDPAISNAHMHRRAEQWLHLCGLEKRSSYFEFAQETRAAIAVQRQTCCQHFRRDGARHCATCPVLTIEERIARLTGTGD